MRSKHLYICGFTPIVLPVIFYYLLLNRRVSVFYLDNYQKNESIFLKRLSLYFDINYIQFPDLLFGSIHSNSIEKSNSIINSGFLEKVIGLSSSLYQSNDIDLFFKRLLSEKLIEYFFFEEYININCYNKEDIFILSRNYSVAQALLSKYGFKDSCNKICHLNVLNSLVARLMFLALLIPLLANVILYSFLQLKNKKIFSQERSKSFEYAFLVSDRIQLKNYGLKNFNFILNDFSITKDNSIFIVEDNLDSTLIRENDTYSIIGMPCKKSVLSEAIGNKKSLTMFQIYLSLLFSRDSGIVSSNDILSLYFNYLKYTKLLRLNNFKKFIYTNREGKSQIVINSLLKVRGINTYYYTMFIGGQYKNHNENTMYGKHRTIFAFMNCTYCMVNNAAMLNSMKEHYQNVDQYFIIGNVPASLVKDSKTNKVDIIPKLKGNWDSVVAIFDTTYVQSEFVYSTYDSGVNFIYDIEKLIKLNPDIFFIYKPAKEDRLLIDRDKMWSNMEIGSIITNKRRDISSLDNAIVLDFSFDSLMVLSISDLVITDCFSSPTADALVCNIPAFWYDSSSLLKGYPFDFENLVVHGFDDLVDRFNECLSLNYNYKKNQGKRYSYMIDPFQDNDGINRLRNIITSDNK